MKPQNHEPLARKWWTPVLLITVAIVWASMITGCGNSNGSAPVIAETPPADPYIVTSAQCAGCPPNTMFLDSAVGEMTYWGAPGLELSLKFYGDASVMAGYPASGGVLAQQSYAGPVIAAGKLLVKQAYPACGIPAGIYNVQSTAPGLWIAKYSFNNLGLTATGPTTAQIQLVSGWVNPQIPPVTAADGAQYPFRIVSRVRMLGAGGTMICDQLMF